MPSLKQRIDDAVQTLVEDVLDLIRTTSLRELEELVSPGAAPARPTLPRRKPPKKSAASPEQGIGRNEKSAASPEQGTGRTERSTAGRGKVPRHDRKPARERTEGRRAPEAQSQFDVTSPELLLAAEPQREAASAKVATEAAPLPQSAPPAAGPTVTMPPVPTLRPGESVARATASGIVIRREKRAIERP
jgi:hypothetical protein